MVPGKLDKAGQVGIGLAPGRLLGLPFLLGSRAPLLFLPLQPKKAKMSAPKSLLVGKSPTCSTALKGALAGPGLYESLWGLWGLEGSPGTAFLWNATGDEASFGAAAHLPPRWEGRH